jgi:plasmid stabilization system protein ParE
VKIIKDAYFTQNLERIVLYIADDSKSRARNFKNSLHKRLNSLDSFPYKFRKSIHFDNDAIRDYVFMGYTIPYLVDNEKDVIVVLDIFKWIKR